MNIIRRFSRLRPDTGTIGFSTYPIGTRDEVCMCFIRDRFLRIFCIGIESGVFDMYGDIIYNEACFPGNLVSQYALCA